MTHWSCRTVALVLLSICPSLVVADVAPAAHPRVPGFARFFEDAKSDAAAGGRLLLSELNCRSCHAGDRSGSGPVTDKTAPVLDTVGDRVRPEWIRTFLSAPHTVKPGTTMPDVLGALPENERLAAAEALTHFLASTGTLQDSHADVTAARRGQALFQSVGCSACHDPVAEDSAASSATLPTSVPLPNLDAKYTLHSLATFLKDPLHVRPSGRMPALGLKDEEYRDIAQHFLRDRTLQPNTEFTVYQGRWEALPDFTQYKPVKKGKSAGFDLGVAGKTDNFGIRFTTNLYLQQPGKYAFTLGSDDGSRLTIDGKVIVDLDGIHPHSEKKVGEPLAAGWHEVQVDYFQGGGEWTLTVMIEGNGLFRQPLASLCSLETDKPLTEQDSSAFVVNPELAAKGQALFASVGCANCHAMTYNEQKIVSTRKAKPWESLPASGGCLAEKPQRGLPDYRLSSRQITAISAAKTAAAPASSPAADVQTTLTTLNCYACHVRGETGGVEEARNALFKSDQPEMGDEGRIPPTLTGVGDKLRDEWLRHVLDKGANDRQVYMKTRMPRFGGRNIGHLTAAFVKLDRQPESPLNVQFDEPDYRVIADGRHLVGGKALSCIKCHDFAKYPSQGVRAVSLTTMTKRLREDWFYRYVANPQDFKPGTRMPAPWPFGQATVRDVLKGNVPQQMVAVWKYLSEGDKGAIPVGLLREPIELVAGDRPVIYRNFIEGAGSRGIAVGYPEKLNLAWDANDMRLAMIWHGAFMDASRHWNARGVGFEPPLGDHVIHLPPGPPVARLGSLTDSWPGELAREHGFHFRGYSLNEKGEPAFRFTYEGLTFTDTCEPVSVEGRKDPELRRTVNIEGSIDQTLYFRVLTAKSIEQTDTAGTWKIDDLWTLRIKGPGTDPAAVVRSLQGQAELLVPLETKAGKSTFVLDYAW